MALKRHVGVARTHHLLSWLYLFLTGLLLIAFIWRGSIPEGDQSIFVLAIFGGMFLLHRHVSNAAMARQAWARAASVVIAVLLLFAFPVGTLAGLFLLYNSREPWETEKGLE